MADLQQASACFAWRALPPLLYPRAQPIAVLLEDGRVLVVGKTGWVWNNRRGWVRRDDLPPEVLDEQRTEWRPGRVAPLARRDRDGNADSIAP